MTQRLLSYFLALMAVLVSIAACTSSKHPSASRDESERRPNAEVRIEADADSRKRDDLAWQHNEVKQAPAHAIVPPPAGETSSAMDKSAHSAARLASGVGMAEMGGVDAPLLDNEKYAHLDQNGVVQVAQHPVSTFSVDVDTGAYANVRRMLKAGQLPQQDAVRIEEMINYFAYDYPLPQDVNVPFSVTTEIAPAPWNRHTHLLQIGIKGQDIAKQMLPPANLVFLIDVSGSMGDANRLPLLQSALKLLTEQLREQDRVAIVVYAGASGVVLPPTNDKAKILVALNRLQAGGSTNGAAGIELAYAVAKQAFIPGGINRVLLATDGDFNVGTVNFDALKSLIEEKRKSGISLTTLGFGMGGYAGERNYNDRLMEQLADAGNGNYAFIDTLNEAQKVLVDEMSSTLATIAKDVKIQIEFNPDVVAEYRLIGYENRALKREDFSNDNIDAGEIGAGHTVTALYEIALTGSKGALLQPLRYKSKTPESHPISGEIAHLRLRYKAPDGSESKLLEWPMQRAAIKSDFAQASERMRFAAAVAGFGQLLKGGRYTGDFGFVDVAKLAQDARGEDRFGYRTEFLSLIKLAQSLGESTPQPKHLSQQ
jgi:Ca-activated chloride channel homolog